MLIQIDEKDSGVVVRIDGRIDARSASDFETKILTQIFHDENKRLILDFSSVEYISSAGLRSLILLAKKMQEGNQKIALCHMNETVYEIIHVTGLFRFFNVYPDIGAALGS